MPRKKPVRHQVKSHIRENKIVRAFLRGSGSKPTKKSTGYKIEPYLGPTIDARAVGTIGDMQDQLEDYSLVTDSQDVEAVKNYFGNPKELDDYDSFFVKEKDGDYSDVLGFSGSVPEFHKQLYKLKSVFSVPKSTSKFKGISAKAYELGKGAVKKGGAVAFGVGKKATNVGVEITRESLSEMYGKVNEDFVRRQIKNVYSPNIVTRNLARSILKNQYPDVYKVLDLKQPNQAKALERLAKLAKAESDEISRSAPED